MIRHPRHRLVMSKTAPLAVVVLLSLSAGSSPAFARPVSHGCDDGETGDSSDGGKASPGSNASSSPTTSSTAQRQANPTTQRSTNPARSGP